MFDYHNNATDTSVNAGYVHNHNATETTFHFESPFQVYNNTARIEEQLFAFPLEEKPQYFLSDVFNFPYVLANKLRIVLHSGMGTGKSYFLQQIQRDYPSERFAFLFIYKNDLLDQFMKRKAYYESQEQEARQEAIRHPSQVMYQTTDVVHMYTTILFDVYLHVLEEYGQFTRANTAYPEDSQAVVQSIIKDRIVISDEADFLSNILHAIANTNSRGNSEQLGINTHLLFAAARRFYEEIDRQAKCVIFMTATYQAEWEAILPVNFVKAEPPMKLRTVNLRSVGIVPMTEWTVNDHTLTATIVYQNIISKPYNKVLLYAPNINLTVIKNLSNIPDKKIAVVANKDKITKQAYQYIDGNPHITLIPFTTETDEDLDSKLTDELVTAHDYIFITNSNCRGISLVRPYGEVLVITIAPIGSETIQASGRFRVPKAEYITEDTPQDTVVDLVMIDRLKEFNQTKGEFDDNKQRMAKKYRGKRFITNNECYDIEFTLRNSNREDVQTYIDGQYVQPDYKFLQSEMPEQLKNHRKSEATLAKIAAIKESLRVNPVKWGGKKHAKWILENKGIEVNFKTIDKYKKDL